jgi:hypothetical protein
LLHLSIFSPRPEFCVSFLYFFYIWFCCLIASNQFNLVFIPFADLLFCFRFFLESFETFPATKNNMSPAIVQAGAGSASKDVKKESATARLLGSGMFALGLETHDQ